MSSFNRQKAPRRSTPAGRFTVEEIARVFAVPTPLIGSMQGATLTNVAHLRVHFAQSTLSTWARRLEAEMARALFSDDEIERMSIEVDLSGILRGDAETRFKSWDVALRHGVLTVNEVREAEGYGPMPAVVPERET